MILTFHIQINSEQTEVQMLKNQSHKIVWEDTGRFHYHYKKKTYDICLQVNDKLGEIFAVHIFKGEY